MRVYRHVSTQAALAFLQPGWLLRVFAVAPPCKTSVHARTRTHNRARWCAPKHAPVWLHRVQDVVDMDVGVRIDLGVDMRIDIWRGMRMDVCIDMCIGGLVQCA